MRLLAEVGEEIKLIKHTVSMKQRDSRILGTVFIRNLETKEEIKYWQGGYKINRNFWKQSMHNRDM